MCKTRILDLHTNFDDLQCVQLVLIKTGCNQLSSVLLQSKQNPKVPQPVVVQLPQKKGQKTGLDQTLKC